MKRPNQIVFLLFVLGIVAACKKDDLEPVGIFESNYYTATDEAQDFYFYYDDGEFVAGGLDEHMVSIHSEAGTFTSEELLLLKYTPNIGELPDSLVPFTYFTGISYQGDLSLPIEYRINYLYPYNNGAHQDNEEYQFFLNNLDKMVLVELEFEAGAEIYYDPNFDLSFSPFTIDQNTNDIVFNTANASSLFGLCWPEESWRDSIYFDIQAGATNTQTAVYSGTRTTSLNAEGATYVSNDVLYLKYSTKSFTEGTDIDPDGWRIREINIAIQNPAVGTIDPNQISFDVLIGKKDGDYYDYTHLLLHANTSIEILNWPDYREYGSLLIDGFLTLQTTLNPTPVTLEINFKRQR